MFNQLLDTAQIPLIFWLSNFTPAKQLSETLQTTCMYFLNKHLYSI